MKIFFLILCVSTFLMTGNVHAANITYADHVKEIKLLKSENQDISFQIVGGSDNHQAIYTVHSSQDNNNLSVATWFSYIFTLSNYALITNNKVKITFKKIGSQFELIGIEVNKDL